MLLFILRITTVMCINTDFNTSHVTVYHQEISIYTVQLHISIHLMLLFISAIFNHPQFFVKFQYISCYCLSIRNGKKEQNSYNFNTSHVTVYRYVTYHKNGIKTFQYISCYCLSWTTITTIFYYINFNTSHVTVYPYFLCITFD